MEAETAAALHQGVPTGKLYVSGCGNASIPSYDNADSVSGVVLPNRTISGGLTTLNLPAGISVDTTNDRLYEANLNANSILVFNNASTASGEIAPSRTVNLPAGTGPGDVFVDITR